MSTDVAVGAGDSTTRQFEAILERAGLISYDPEPARRAVDIQRERQADGRRIGGVDAMIAGTAVARDEPIVTRNVDEFTRTPARVSPY